METVSSITQPLFQELKIISYHNLFNIKVLHTAFIKTSKPSRAVDGFIKIEGVFKDVL